MGLNILIGIEIFYPQINGLVTTTLNLAKNFKHLGHNPIILTPRVVKDSPEEVDGIPIYYVASTSYLLYPGLRMVNFYHPIFKQLIEKHNIDIIQTTAPWYIGKGLNKVAKKQHIPIVNSFHTNLHNPGYIQYIAPLIMNKHTIKTLQRIVWRAAKSFLKPCDVLVAPSPDTCSDLRHQFPKKQIEWIPNGVEIDMFQSEENTELLQAIIPDMVKNHYKYAVFIGRLAKEKSVDELIQAVSIVKEKVPDFRLVIVGDGPKEKEYHFLAEKLGLNEHIYFLGRIDHKLLMTSGLVKKSRFFTTASTTETHSMTVTEALCCGTPVVVSDHPSMTYFTQDTSIYFTPHDPQSIAEAFEKMWNDDELYAPLKKNAEHMLDKFDGEAIAKKYVTLYEQLLEIKKKR